MVHEKLLKIYKKNDSLIKKHNKLHDLAISRGKSRIPEMDKLDKEKLKISESLKSYKTEDKQKAFNEYQKTRKK